MKRNKKQKGVTIAEASSFFDEHDIFEFEDVHEVTDIKFKLQKKKYVGLDMELFKKIRNRAKRLHKHYAKIGNINILVKEEIF